jgi:hypothetical protein
MKKITAIRLISLTAVLIFGISMAVSVASGQTRKKRTSKITPTQATPAQPQTQPEIISRADDYGSDSGVINLQTDQQNTTQTEPIDTTKQQLSALKARVKNLESNKETEYDQKQKRLALNLEILNRAEQRAESLRKQHFDMIEKAGAIKAKLEEIDNNLRPEMIERTVAMTGSLRPEELRDARKKNLEAERTSQQSLLEEVQSTLARLDESVRKADDLVDRLRAKLDKDIDAALVDDDSDQEKPD